MDVRNRLANDVIVVPVSPVLSPAPTHDELQAGEGGLPARSVAKCEQVGTILKARLELPSLSGSLSALRLGRKALHCRLEAPKALSLRLAARAVPQLHEHQVADERFVRQQTLLHHRGHGGARTPQVLNPGGRVDQCT